MEVLCYAQLGVWVPTSQVKCLSASPILMAPLMRRITKIFQDYQSMNNDRFYLSNTITIQDDPRIN